MMNEMLPAAARYLVFVLAFAVAFSSAATCLAAAAAATPKAPCHGSEHQPVQDDSGQLNCCPSDSPNSESPVPALQAPGSPTASPVLIAVLPVSSGPPFARRPGIVDVAAGRPKLPGIATYVLVSSFRI
jgi:hypothetical protein